MEREPVGPLLGEICRLSHMRMHSLLEDLDLYRGQPQVLRALWDREGITHSELAQILHVRPSTVTNTVQRMEKAGFVKRRDDSQDHRVSRVYLTDAGRDIRSQLQEIWKKREQEAFAGFNQEDQELLCRFLVRMRDNLLCASKKEG